MEVAEPVKSGYLLVPGQGFLKKIWNKRYYALYGASNNGIQRLEMFDNEECSLRQSPAKIIPLTDCVKVNSVLQKNQSNVFEVRTKEHVHMFSADSFHEMNDWLANIQGVAFGSGVKQPCPFIKQPEPTTPPSLVSSQHEDNLIYSSVDAPETYPVGMIESEATIRCKLQGSYQLMLTSVGITLSDPSIQIPTKATFMWSYRHIRRYGYSNTTFSFEAGRKSASGEGLFTFNTKDGAGIFQSIAARVNSLKMFKNETEPYSPSPQGESPTFSDTLNRNTLVKLTKDHGYGVINSTTPIPKPPRRSKLSSESLPLPGNCNIYEDPQLVDKLGEGDYDEPEERMNAWKTLGQDCADSYPITSDPTYEDLSYASADAIQVVDIAKLSLVSENVKQQSNSLPRIRNSIVQSNLYGRVNNKRSTVVSTGPDYENLLVSSEGNGQVSTKSFSDSQEPTRILCNEVEYAQIIRKKK